MPIKSTEKKKRQWWSFFFKKLNINLLKKHRGQTQPSDMTQIILGNNTRGPVLVCHLPKIHFTNPSCDPLLVFIPPLELEVHAQPGEILHSVQLVSHSYMNACIHMQRPALSRPLHADFWVILKYGPCLPHSSKVPWKSQTPYTIYTHSLSNTFLILYKNNNNQTQKHQWMVKGTRTHFRYKQYGASFNVSTVVLLMMWHYFLS